MTTEALKESLGIAPKATPETFPQMLIAWKREIAVALPKHLNADAMARIALTCFRMTPKLQECVPSTIFACVVQASQLGLRPGLLGECYLIPYKKGKGPTAKTICTLQLGYQGMIELARRSGQIIDIAAYAVREKDKYEVRFGSDPGIVHVPNFKEEDRGRIILAYAVADLKGGGKHAEVMTIHDIYKNHRDRSQNYQQAKRYHYETPWDTDEEEMTRKTMVRRIYKYLPKSNEMAIAAALDDNASLGRQELTIQDAMHPIEDIWVPEAIDVESTERNESGPGGEGGDGQQSSSVSSPEGHAGTSGAVAGSPTGQGGISGTDAPLRKSAMAGTPAQSTVQQK